MAVTGRPNLFDPIILGFLRNRGGEGATLTEIADEVEELQEGTLSTRGLNYAALRLMREGKLARRYEFVGRGTGIIRLYRYWLVTAAPKNDPRVERP